MTPNSSGAVLNSDWWRNQWSVITNQTKQNGTLWRVNRPKRTWCFVVMSQCCNHEAMRKQMHENHKRKNNDFVQMVSNFLFKHLSWGCQKKIQAELHWWCWPLITLTGPSCQKRLENYNTSDLFQETANFCLDTNGLCKVREDYVVIKCLWVPWTDCFEVGTKRGRTIVNSNFKAWFLSPG